MIWSNYTEIRNGVIYIDEKGESQIKSKVKTKSFSVFAENSETLPETAETLLKTTETVSGNQPETVVLLIELLQKQLETKDKQISDLNDRLAEAHQELRTAQTLHAGTQTQLLPDMKISAPEKTSLRNKIFKRGHRS
jgi:hypothetical protein